MNKNYIGFKSLSLSLIAATALTVVGCTSDHDEFEQAGTQVEPPTNAETGRYGLVRTDVMNYFAQSLNGDQTEYTTEAPLDAAQYDAAKNYVWSLWKASVNRAGGEKLARLTSHYEIDDWGAITQGDMTWQVPEGGMKIFLASKGSRPATGYPLFLQLHGSGSNADLEWTASTGWVQVFKDSPSAWFIPRSPQGGTGVRWFQPSKQEKWEQMLRLAMVSGDYDPSKIYFMGISEGAYGSQRLASFYADYLAGAGPIAGGEFMQNCPPENLANLAFCLQTGENDLNNARDILTRSVGEKLDSLAAAHPGYYTHKVDIQAGMGHGCDYTKTSPWLRDYSRNAAPKYVAWENFGMGGINGEPYRYRDTFYNLRILTPSDDRTNPMVRTRYDMTIEGNTVDITVRTVTLKTYDSRTVPTGTFDVAVAKSYTPATTGKLRVYLSPELVDLSKPVTVMVNGAQAFSGTVNLDMRHMVETARLYFDPMRVYPAAVDVDVK